MITKIVPWENPFDKMELSYKRKNSRSQTKGRDNGEHKLRPTPARQSSTLRDGLGLSHLIPPLN